MVLFKHIIAPLLSILSLCFSAALAGLFLLWFTRHKKTGRGLVTLPVLALAAFSLRPLADPPMRALENIYPPLAAPPAVPFVVVLGGGAVAKPDIPASSQLNHGSLVRLVEGISLHRRIPGSRLIVTGAALSDRRPIAAVMAEVAENLGVAADLLITLDTPRDTEEEAIAVREVVGEAPFLLVSSAAHLPRAMALFRKAGLAPTPAPTGYAVRHEGGPSARDLIPLPGNIDKVEKAWHEVLGITWARLRGRL